MPRMLDRITARGLMRWSLSAVFLALMVSIIPDYFAADPLPTELQLVRGLGHLAMLVLAVLLVRARHASALRKLVFQVLIVMLMLFEAVLKLGFNARIVALLAVWVVMIWVEWRRIAEEERRFA